jgi:hypothetical protein
MKAAQQRENAVFVQRIVWRIALCKRATTIIVVKTSSNLRLDPEKP